MAPGKTAPPPPRSRLRRVLRGIGIALASLVGLVVLLLAALFLVGRSDFGRRQILHAVLPLVQDVLAGQLRIGALDGDLTHMLVLRDVEIYDTEGQLAARVRRIGVRYNLLALLNKTVHLTAIHAEGGYVRVRTLSDGSLNVARLVKLSDKPSGPIPITLLLNGIEADVEALYEGPPGPLARAHTTAHVEAAVRVDRSGVYADLDALRAQLDAPVAATITARGEVSVPAGGVHFKGVQVTVRTTGDEINRLAPVGLIGSYELAAAADGTLSELKAQVTLKPPAGQIRADATLGLLDPRLPLQLRLAVEGLDPAALRADLPSGRVDLVLHGQGQGLPLQGRVELEKLTVAALAATVSASARVEVPPPPAGGPLLDWRRLTADATLDVDARDLAKLAQLTKLAQVAPPPLSGALKLSVKAGLQNEKIAADVGATGRSLRFPPASVDQLSLEVHTKDALAIRGDVKLAAQGLSAAGWRFAQLAVAAAGGKDALSLKVSGDGPEDVAFRLALAGKPLFGADKSPARASPTGAEADLTELSLRRGSDTLLLGKPAHLRADLAPAGGPVVDVNGLDLSLGEQHVAVDAHFEAATQRLRAAVKAERIDAHKLAQLAAKRDDVPETRLALQASVAGTVADPSGSVLLEGDVLALPGTRAERTEVRVAGKLAQRRAAGELRVQVMSPQGGPLVVAHFDAPISGTGKLHTDVTAEATLEALTGLVPGVLPPVLKSVNGPVNLRVDLDGTLAQPQLAVKLNLPSWGLELAGPPSLGLRGDGTALIVSYAAERAQVDVDLTSRFAAPSKQPLGGLHLVASVPLRARILPPSAPADIVRQLREGRPTAELTLVGLDLPAILALVAPPPTPPSTPPPLQRGTAEVRVTAAGPLSDPSATVRVDVRDVTYALNPTLPLHLTAGLGGTYRGGAVSADLDAALEGKPLVRAHAETRLPIATLLAAPPPDADAEPFWKRLPITARLDVLPSDLPPSLPLRGTFALHADASGTAGDPTVKADVKGSKLFVADWPLGDLTAGVTLTHPAGKSQLLHAEADIRELPQGGQTRGGELHVRADVPLPLDIGSRALSATVDARDFRVDYEPPASQAGSLKILRGKLDGSLTVYGAKPIPVASGTLRLSGGTLGLSALPQILRKIVVELTLDEKGLIWLRHASAVADAGAVVAEARVYVRDQKIQSANLDATATRFPIAAGPIGLWLDTHVHATAQLDGDTLRADVKIPDGTVRLPKLGSTNSVQSLGPLDDVVYLDAAAEREEDKKHEKEEKKAEKEQQKIDDGCPPIPLLPSRVLASVKLPGPFSVQGPEVKTDLQGHVDADFRQQRRGGKCSSLSITGLVQTEGGGWVDILSRRYQLDRARVSLDGEDPPNPTLDVQISRRIDDVTIFVNVSGTAMRPRITFGSDPANLDQGQIIAMVVSGQGGKIQQQALGVLSSLVTSQLKDQLGAALPLDVVKFDVGGNDASSSAMAQSSLEVGKYLRDDLYLSYMHRFGNTLTGTKRYNDNQVGLEWRFLRWFQFNIQYGDQNVGALNFYWTRRF